MIPFLLDHLWQSTLFAAALGILTLAFRHNSAGVRYWLWFAASVKFLIPFSALIALGAILFQAFAPPAVPVFFADMQPAAEPFSGGEPLLLSSPATQEFNWALLLLALWALGFVIIVAMWLGRWRKMGAAVASALPLPLDATMPVKSSTASLEPGLVGIWRPVLLLPQGIIEHLAPLEMQSIMAHESCHLRRRDNLLAAVHMGVEALFWFHPLVWWLGARLIAERENACDEAVLATGSDPQTYAQSILKVCQFYMHSPLACASGVSGGDLTRRIETIMENRIAIRLNAMKKGLLAATAAAAIAAPLAAGMLTSSPVMGQAVGIAHPGTEAALRHQIESMEKGQADFDAMIPGLARALRSESRSTQAYFQKWGALKSIAFRANDNGDDVYLVTFEHQLTAWAIGPVGPDGKIGTLAFFNAVKRDGNGPSPGLEAAIRRDLIGRLAGKPMLEIMSPELQTATRQQWKRITAAAKFLGAVQTITFQGVNLQGWDVYRVTFANGIQTVKAEPLKHGKLDDIQHTDLLLPRQPQHPGTEAWLRRDIVARLKGTPDYEDMEPGLANAVREQWPEQRPLFKALGSLQSLTFEGGGRDGDTGLDVYLAKFQNGEIRWQVEAPDASGKVNRLSHKLVNDAVDDM